MSVVIGWRWGIRCGDAGGGGVLEEVEYSKVSPGETCTRLTREGRDVRSLKAGRTVIIRFIKVWNIAPMF